MEDNDKSASSGLSETQKPAIRFLVETALRKVVTKTGYHEPRTRSEWIERLCDALMSESETSHQTAIAQLMSSGVTSEELFQSYIPAVARRLGELWLGDRATFVDVTVAASRLQALFRGQERHDSFNAHRWLDRSIPLGESVLMLVPEFEHHSLGAFVAADNLRRHGLWMHMGIGLNNAEAAELIRNTRFSMLGVTAATWNSVVKVSEIVDYLRSKVDELPPGGTAVQDKDKVLATTGADFAVTSAREAIERCGLKTVADATPFQQAT